jgi:Flp pilus assembly protein TadD
VRAPIPAAGRSPGETRSTPSYGVRIQPPGAPATPASRQSAAVPVVAAAGSPDRELAPIYELMQRGQWEQARTAILALSARAPTSARYRALLSYSHGREAQLDRRLDEARVELDTALQLDPDLQIAKTALAELFTRRK